MTNKKNRGFNPNSNDDINLFKQCMIDEQVLRIVLTNSDRKKRNILFGLTIDFPSWATVVSFEVSHSYFVSEVERETYLKIIKDLITKFNPVYAMVDDIEESIEILKKSREETYRCVTEYIPSIFWGNYFGEKYVSQFGKDKLLNSHYGISSSVGNGILITMDNNPMNYNTIECTDNRKRLSKYLHVGKPNSIKKLLGI